MKKIHVAKSDSLASVIGKIVRSREDKIVLYIPRSTELGSSRQNFALLKREVEAAGKEIIVESVDEDVLELADTAGLRAVNPFTRRRQRAVSDIVVVTSRGVPTKRPRKEARAEEEAGPVGEREPREALEEESRQIAPKRFFIALGITAFGAISFVLVMTALPRAKIELTLEKRNLDFVGTMVTSPTIKENIFNNNEVRVRGVTFLDKRNATKAYPASGRRYVERKAVGEVALYNAYSSAPQTLIRTTRLVTPDGRIYRLDNTITIPGAKIEGGKISPVGIRASVTADKPGAEYNLEPVVKLRIPGFQNSPKYDGFYAEVKEPIAGGFTGESRAPTEDDTKSATADIERVLEEAIKTQLLFNLPPEVKILNNAYEFKIIDKKINEVADESGKFTVTAYGEAKLIGFREQELVETLGKGLLSKNGNNFKVESHELEYGNPTINPSDGSLTVPIKFKSVWSRFFDIARFKEEAAGKNRNDLKSLVFSTPGVQSGEIRLWPFWVSRVPNDPNRIVIDPK